MHLTDSAVESAAADSDAMNPLRSRLDQQAHLFR